MCFVSLYLFTVRERFICLTKQRGIEAGVSQPFRLGVEPVLGLMTRCCVVLGDIYCNTFLVRPTWREGGPDHCQRPQTFVCVVNMYTLYLPVHTYFYTVNDSISVYMYFKYNTYIQPPPAQDLYGRICLNSKPSQSVNWGRRLARSASRRPPVC